ncbi:MAG TPA: DUF4352 domain-containing protein [Spirochaetota bacterium]|nr:DUF4352 domain-containing protein [Spirochaetota bacterium]
MKSCKIIPITVFISGIIINAFSTHLTNYIKIDSRIDELNLKETVNVAGISITLKNIRLSAGTSHKPAPEGYVYYLFDFIVSNKTSQTIWLYDKTDFMLKDRQGYTYENVFHTICKGNLYTKLFKNNLSRGELAYAVPRNHKKLKIYFDFSGFGYNIHSAWLVPDMNVKKAKTEPPGNATPQSSFKELLYIKNKLQNAVNRPDENKFTYRIYNSRNTLVEKGQLKNNLHYGPFKSYRQETGLLITGDAAAGMLEQGFIKQFYILDNMTNNLKIKAVCDNSQLNGTVKIYNKDKSLKARLNMKDNRKHGKCVIFYPSGKIQAELEFKNNRPDGSMLIYSENGKLQKEIVFEDEQKVKAFSINNNGEKSAASDFDLKKNKVYQTLNSFPL